ncbi:flavin reductase family protein [Hyperthermus butylicus]|uniref:flavin reductase family protein n=1 Tax=Hyperthermus butylicus TaxID=54248 RepID=UPI000D7253D2|nr:flavin reductase family protein [Hyperthermus butylicus]
MPGGYVEAGDKWYYILHPRPAYILVTEYGGRVNFMAASWVMPLSEDPPRIVAALDKASFTMELILSSKAFTVNVLTIDHVDFIYAAGTTSGRRVDKLAVLGAEISRDTVTGVPRLSKPRPIGVIEASVYRVYSDVAEDVHLIVADVVAAYADPEFFNEKYGWDLRKARIAIHAAGRAFTIPGGLYIAKKLAAKH